MREIVRQALAEIVPEGIDSNVTVPDHEAHGEYSTNVAFALAKREGGSPEKRAEELAAKLRERGTLFREVRVEKPGHLNFWLAPDLLRAEVASILAEGVRYGRRKAAPPKKIQVEFISANPTGPLTLANGRGGFLGDVIANILEAQGHEVEREYYVNDTGNQVVTLGKSILAAAGLIPQEETFYKGDYLKEWALAHRSEATFYKDDPHALGRIAARDFLHVTKSVIEGKANILFNRYTSEFDDIHAKGYAEKVLALFRLKGTVYEKDGATWLRTTEFGDDKDRVLKTKDGVPTYFLADAGHYLETVERGFTTKVNILGPDHYGYVARIQAAAKLVGLADSTVIITQAVRLVEGDAEVKMSKRKGTFITFNELLASVPPDAARFFFLMISADSHLDFDLSLAKERSMKNPVYYVEYAYVRATNILKNAGAGPAAPDLSPLSTPDDLRLIRTLARFPEALEDTAADYRAHRLTRYAMDLARTFHDWYEKERVVGEVPAVFAARRALVLATHSVLGNLFSLIGISAPEEM
ncbi:MAG: arginine--tRNA ligase [Patescibacteria group bacterium]